MTPEEAIQQLEFDRAMILFDSLTGEEITPEMLKLINKENYLTYVADGIAIEALKEIQYYREMDKRLREAFGECDCLLETAVDSLCRHEGEDIGSPVKSRLLTDETVDKWDAYLAIGTVEECREAREKQTPKRPVWKKGLSIICKDYADGHGEVEENKWADWVCPNCGWFVGEQYIPRRHNQQKSNYCSRCGQAIQWDKNLKGMEDEL